MTKDINYALMLIKANRLEGARDLLEELLQNDRGNQDILYNLGICHSELGDLEKSATVLSECVRLFPQFSNAYVALGFAYAKCSNHEKAKENFLKALEIDPENAHALQNLGGIYAKENDIPKSIECLEKAFSLNPKDQRLAYGLGYALFQGGKPDKADEYLRIAVDLDESPSLTHLAKELRTEIAQLQLKAKGFRGDAMFYCLSALGFFQDKNREQVRKVTLEIALKGQQGLDINDPEKKYTLTTMDGSFSGLELTSYMYVGFKKLEPGMDMGVDLAEEYNSALALFNKEKPHGFTFN